MNNDRIEGESNMKKTTKAQSQRDMILEHLRSGKSITIREAFNIYGVQSLTKRLSELRAEGFDIINYKTLEDGIEVGVWVMRRDPYKNQTAPFVRGDKVRLKALPSIGHICLRVGMVGEILHCDRRNDTSMVDIAGIVCWIANSKLERFVPLAPGTKVTITGPAWVADYNIDSNTYTIQTLTHEFVVPATQVALDVTDDDGEKEE
jgi:hypothetical protein